MHQYHEFDNRNITFNDLSCDILGLIVTDFNYHSLFLLTLVNTTFRECPWLSQALQTKPMYRFVNQRQHSFVIERDRAIYDYTNQPMNPEQLKIDLKSGDSIEDIHVYANEDIRYIFIKTIHGQLFITSNPFGDTGGNNTFTEIPKPPKDLSLNELFFGSDFILQKNRQGQISSYGNFISSSEEFVVQNPEALAKETISKIVVNNAYSLMLTNDNKHLFAFGKQLDKQISEVPEALNAVTELDDFLPLM